jgi:hypothetical protein
VRGPVLPAPAHLQTICNSTKSYSPSFSMSTPFSFRSLRCARDMRTRASGGDEGCCRSSRANTVDVNWSLWSRASWPDPAGTRITTHAPSEAFRKSCCRLWTLRAFEYPATSTSSLGGTFPAFCAAPCPCTYSADGCVPGTRTPEAGARRTSPALPPAGHRVPCNACRP